MIKLNSR